VVKISGPVTFTFTVSNTGDNNLGNIVLTDSLPGVIPQYVSGDVNNNNTLEPDETWVYSAIVMISETIDNTAVVTGTDGLSNTVSDQSTVRVTVNEQPRVVGGEVQPTNLFHTVWLLWLMGYAAMAAGIWWISRRKRT